MRQIDHNGKFVFPSGSQKKADINSYSASHDN